MNKGSSYEDNHIIITEDNRNVTKSMSVNLRSDLTITKSHYTERYLLKISLDNRNPKSKDARQRAFRAGSILRYRTHSRRTPEVVTNRGKFPLAPCYWTTVEIPEILHRGGKDEETSPVREGYFLDWFFVVKNERLMGSECKFCSKAS